MVQPFFVKAIFKKMKEFIRNLLYFVKKYAILTKYI